MIMQRLFVIVLSVTTPIVAIELYLIESLNERMNSLLNKEYQ